MRKDIPVATLVVSILLLLQSTSHARHMYTRYTCTNNCEEKFDLCESIASRNATTTAEAEKLYDDCVKTKDKCIKNCPNMKGN